MSGMIIDRRDQVLIGRRLFAAAAARTFFSRWSSINGPFLIERGTYNSSKTLWLYIRALSADLFTAPASDDHIVRPLVIAGLLTLGRRTPR